jgi:hypothetical protein
MTLTAEEMRELRKAIRLGVKNSIRRFKGAHDSATIIIHDGTQSSVRFSVRDHSGHYETCYDVSITKLGRRRVF